MPLEIHSKPTQVYAEFGDSDIIENRPIAFPYDRGSLHPYTSLFYMGNLYCSSGTTIADHTHQGFEIFNYVVKGEIEHYDNVTKKKLKLSQGDVYLIQAGKGIVHSESYKSNCQILQIWFNPDLRKTLLEEARVTFAKKDDIENYDLNKMKVRVLANNDSVLQLETEDIQIKELEIFHGGSTLNINPNHYYSLYLLKGGLEVNGRILNEDDFMIVTDEAFLELTATKEVKLITIESTSEIDYKTYYELYQHKYNH